jgi:hypothetical protein
VNHLQEILVIVESTAPVPYCERRKLDMPLSSAGCAMFFSRPELGVVACWPTVEQGMRARDFEVSRCRYTSPDVLVMERLIVFQHILSRTQGLKPSCLFEMQMRNVEDSDMHEFNVLF